MKRMWMPILLCAMILLASCGDKPKETSPSSTPTEGSTETSTPSETSAENSPEEEAEKDSEFSLKSLKLTTKMANGEFQPVCDLFSAKVKETGITPDILEGVWKQTVQELGKMGENMDAKVEKNGEVRKVTVRVEFEKKDMLVLFVYNEAKEIDGLWMKATEKGSSSDARKPRHPEAPIRLGEKPVEGSLMLPKEAEKPPVAILIPGSGPSDRDETVYENRPFLDIAEGLADRGIASLRFDKRSLRYPEDVKTVDDEILNDVREAIRMLRSEGRIDPDRIFLLGHSMGGMVAPLLASEHPEVRGIISVAGSPRELEDIIYDQVMSYKRVTEEDRKRTEEHHKRVKTLKEGDADAPFELPASYWFSLRELRPGERAKQLTIPMFFLQGEADFQVMLDKDFGEWKKILAGKPKVTFRSYPKLNHLMMPTQGEKDPTDYLKKSTVDATVLQDICDWILAQ